MYDCIKMRIKTCLPPILINLFVCGLCFAQINIEDTAYLEVVKIEGKILYWSPLDTDWRTVTLGDHIFGETIIQATEQANLVVKRKNSSGLEMSDSLAISFTEPTIVRLHRKLNRDVVLTSFSMNVEKNNFPLGSGLTVKESPRKTLPSAWERVKKMGGLLLNLTEEDFNLIKNKTPVRSVAIPKKSYDIKVKVPSDGSVYMVDKFPAEVPLVWESQSLDGPAIDIIDVHIEDERRKVKLQVTRTNRRGLILAIPEAGIYKVSVSSPDENFESEAISFSIESADRLVE